MSKIERKGREGMNILCRILGHSFEPEDNPIGAVYKDFIYYDRKMVCKRCKSYYKDSFLKQNFNKQSKVPHDRH